VNVLLSGATGFLGSHLSTTLLSDGHNLTALKRKTSSIPQHLELASAEIRWLDATDIDSILTHGPYDSFIHAATDYGRGKSKITNCLETNTLFPLRVIEELGLSLKRVIHCNTCFNLVERNSYPYVAEYQLSKRHFSHWGELLATSHGIDFCDVIIFHPYGQYDSRTKFIPWLIEELTNGQRDDLALTSGTQIRDFTHVKDVAESLAHLVKTRDLDGFNQLEAGTGIGTSIREFVELAHQLSKSQRRLDFGALQLRPGEIERAVASTDPMERLGWKSRVNLMDGLTETIHSHLEAKCK
jgi:nucleoside-diphosphate-sugar epimerase